MRPIGDWSTRTSLSSPSSPVIRVCRPGTWRAPLSLLASTVARMSLISVDLPEPDTPVTDDQAAERDVDVDAAQVVLAGPDDR